MSNFFSGTGNVGKAPELRTVNNGGNNSKVLELRVFFDAYKKDVQGEFVQDDAACFWKDVVLWNERAERAAEHLVKGARIHVVGSVKGEQWTDKTSGEIRTNEFVVAEDVFLSFARVEKVTYRQKTEPAAQTGAVQHDEAHAA
jgi:single-strand DNA-binding protein